MNILIEIILFLWQLPQNLVGLIMYPFMWPAEKMCSRNHSTCYASKNMNGGISLGRFIYINWFARSYTYHISHEIDGHTKQSKILGPLYLIVIGLPSLLWAAFRNKDKHPNYYTFYTEKWANKCAKLEAYEKPNGKWDLKPID